MPGTLALLNFPLTYISHKVLQRVRGHLQSTLLSSLGVPSAQRNIPVSSTQMTDSLKSALAP